MPAGVRHTGEGAKLTKLVLPRPMFSFTAIVMSMSPQQMLRAAWSKCSTDELAWNFFIAD